MAKIKSLYSDGAKNAKAALNICADLNLPYTVVETNYTTEIISDFCNVYFMADELSKKTFAAANKIKKDILKTGLTPPELEDNNFYFEFSPDQLCNRPFVFNIDIKSAYAYALFNHKLISKKTFNYMKALNKKERLASVGMLASAKDYFECLGNETIKHRYKQEETKDWFFFAVYSINKVMDEIKEAIKDAFLFYWVDGVFFSGYKNVEIIMAILNKHGYKYSFEICTGFKYQDNERERTLSYFKENGKEKILSLPNTNSEIQDYLLKLLGLK